MSKIKIETTLRRYAGQFIVGQPHQIKPLHANQMESAYDLKTTDCFGVRHNDAIVNGMVIKKRPAL